jgi:hypothetical protein
MGTPTPATGRIHDDEFRKHFRRTLITFATALGYYNGLFDAVYMRGRIASGFWFATTGSHFDTAVIDWCKVMGTDSEELHWKKAFDGSDHDSLRAGILAATEKSAAEWRSYHKEILTYRNKVGAHVDPKARIHDYPMLGPAQTAAGVIYGRLEALYKVGGPNIDLICKRASRGAQAAAEAYVRGWRLD